MKNIYLVLSQTRSILSRIISRATGDRYAHVSLSLSDDLDEMYSFGRVYAFTPIIGGFVREKRRSPFCAFPSKMRNGTKSTNT